MRRRRMRQERKKGTGKGKDEHPDGAKEAEDRFQETKKKQIGTAENSVTSFFISARTVG